MVKVKYVSLVASTGLSAKEKSSIPVDLSAQTAIISAATKEPDDSIPIERAAQGEIPNAHPSQVVAAIPVQDRQAVRDQELLRSQEIGFAPHWIECHGSVLPTDGKYAAHVGETAGHKAVLEDKLVSPALGSQPMEPALVHQEETRPVEFQNLVCPQGVCTVARDKSVSLLGSSSAASDMELGKSLQQSSDEEHAAAHVENALTLTLANLSQEHGDALPEHSGRVEMNKHTEVVSIQLDSSKEKNSLEQSKMVSPVASAPSPVAASPCSNRSISSKATHLSAPAAMEPHADYSGSNTCVALEDESDYNDELVEDIIIQDKNGRLRIVTQPKKFQSSSYVPTNVQGALAVHNLSNIKTPRSAPSLHIGDSQPPPQMDTDKDTSNPEETPFQQQKPRRRKRKQPLVQVDASGIKALSRSMATFFNVLSED